MCFLVPSFYPWLYSFFSGRYKKNLEPTLAGADRTGLTVLKVQHLISLQGLSIPLLSSFGVEATEVTEDTSFVAGWFNGALCPVNIFKASSHVWQLELAWINHALTVRAVRVDWVETSWARLSWLVEVVFTLILPSVPWKQVFDSLGLIWCHLEGKAKKEGLHVTRVGNLA
jgi:hypothetical protein